MCAVAELHSNRYNFPAGYPHLNIFVSAPAAAAAGLAHAIHHQRMPTKPD